MIQTNTTLLFQVQALQILLRALQIDAHMNCTRNTCDDSINDETIMEALNTKEDIFVASKPVRTTVGLMVVRGSKIRPLPPVTIVIMFVYCKPN